MTFYNWSIIAIFGMLEVMGLCVIIPLYLQSRGKNISTVLIRFFGFLVNVGICLLIVFCVEIVPPACMLIASYCIFVSKPLIGHKGVANVFDVFIVICCTCISIPLAGFMYG